MNHAENNEFAPDWPPRDPLVCAALEESWASGDWGRYHGVASQRLNDLLCERFRVPHAYLCCSGTFAVELALRTLNLPPACEVALAGYDFAGNFRAIEAIGARPVLLDCAANSWTFSPESLASLVGSPVKAIIVSHLHGELVDMPRVMQFAAQHGWSVVEDACQAPGALHNDRPIGSFGDIGVLSFGGSKLLTAGRGGAILTHEELFLQRAVRFCEQGNHAYPLSELQACVLGPQFASLSSRHELRTARVARLRALAATISSDAISFSVPEVSSASSPAYYKFGFRIRRRGDDLSAATELRDRAATRFRAAGIAIDAGFRGFVQRSESRCRKVGSLPGAAQVAAETLVLHHPILIAEDALWNRFLARFEAVLRTFITEETP